MIYIRLKNLSVTVNGKMVNSNPQKAKKELFFLIIYPKKNILNKSFDNYPCKVILSKMI